MATPEISTELRSAGPSRAVRHAVEKLPHSQSRGSAKGRVKISMLVLKELTSR
ncbi:hypothetical protein GA0115252_13783 [Streptomyces sp. DfronAA-171]|nr:hypothetical protein GA0115252_13783 [Streptomyces sp. DfronAA-171]